MQAKFRQYDLKTELARKHSHSTYLASLTNPQRGHGEPDHEVILTVFSSWLFSSPLERENLLLKAEGIRQLRHPYLISILDIGIEKEQPFVVREYLPNGSLRGRLKNIFPDRLPLAEALSFVLQVGQALVSVHQHDIVHGSIKPENILFDTDGQVRLADFSLVFKSDVLIRDRIAEEYAFCYMAPEQFRGINDARSDQYALGCLAYELITGQVPFAARTLSSIIGHRSDALPIPLSNIVANLPASLEAAVLKALAKDPAERFFDFSVFVDVVQSALEPSPAFPLLLPTHSRNKRIAAHTLPKSVKDATFPFIKTVVSPTSTPQPSEVSRVSSDTDTEGRMSGATVSVAIADGISSAITIHSLTVSQSLLAEQEKTNLLLANPSAEREMCDIPLVLPTHSVDKEGEDVTNEIVSADEETCDVPVVLATSSIDDGHGKNGTRQVGSLIKNSNVHRPRIARARPQRGWMRNFIWAVLLIFGMASLIVYAFVSFVMPQAGVDLGTITKMTYTGSVKTASIPKLQPSVLVAGSPTVQSPPGLIAKNSTLPLSSQTPTIVPVRPISLPSISHAISHGDLLSRSGWTASASSPNALPLDALDGNDATLWSTGQPQSNGQWFLVNMGSTYYFSKITLDASSSSDDYPRGYQVFVSNDGSNWGSAIASGNGSGQVVTISFATQSARFIKVMLTASASNWWSIGELNVYNGSSALNHSDWTASASESNLIPLNALDGDSSTRWSTGQPQSSGQWFEVDMGSVHSLTRITLDASSSSDDYPRGYQVFVSNDGSNWGSAIASGNSSGQVVTISFAPQSARFIKVMQTSSASNWWSIDEFNAYS